MQLEAIQKISLSYIRDVRHNLYSLWHTAAVSELDNSDAETDLLRNIDLLDDAHKSVQDWTKVAHESTCYLPFILTED